MTSSLFGKPAGEWTDEELHHGAVQAALRRNELAAAGQTEQAEFLNDLCVDLVEERERRKALARAVEDAMLPSIDITDALTQDPPDPDRKARLSRAVAEWQAGTARPARTKVMCPRGDATSLGVFETSVGLLLAGKAPMPYPRTSSDQRQIPYAMLLEGLPWAGSTPAVSAAIDAPAAKGRSGSTWTRSTRLSGLVLRYIVLRSILPVASRRTRTG
jgi:hypothetical protein